MLLNRFFRGKKRFYNKKKAHYKNSISNRIVVKSPANFYNWGLNKHNKIFLKLSFTNTFITALDCDDKVVACYSAGACGVVGTSRRKRAPQAVVSIVAKLSSVLYGRNIRQVILLVYSNRTVQGHYYLARELAYHGVKVIGFVHYRKFAHNGVRARKLPRK